MEFASKMFNWTGGYGLREEMILGVIGTKKRGWANGQRSGKIKEIRNRKGTHRLGKVLRKLLKEKGWGKYNININSYFV